MAANPLRIQDLIARAIEAGEIVEGVNDTETLIRRVTEIANRLHGVHSSRVFSDDGIFAPLKSSPEVELIDKALRVAGSPERLAEWMQTPVPALNGQTPYSLMQTEEGRKQVDDVLGRIEHGVY